LVPPPPPRQLASSECLPNSYSQCVAGRRLPFLLEGTKRGPNPTKGALRVIFFQPSSCGFPVVDGGGGGGCISSVVPPPPPPLRQRPTHGNGSHEKADRGKSEGAQRPGVPVVQIVLHTHNSRDSLMRMVVMRRPTEAKVRAPSAQGFP
jgi:hypothetical protein